MFFLPFILVLVIWVSCQGPIHDLIYFILAFSITENSFENSF